jgi:hypothetical protein
MRDMPEREDGRLTWILPASPNCGRVAQDKYDENKAASDEGGPNPVHPPIFLGRRLIFVNDQKSQDQAREGET